MLQVRGLAARYGSSQVLFGIDLDVGEGELVTLMGRNGMGKTTTVRAIVGLTPPFEGSVRFGGAEIAAEAAHLRARRGIGLVPEGRQIFATLSVEENLRATARPGPWSLQRVLGLFPRLAERRNHMGRQLSGGEQQMLAIGRALMTNPRLLILDEATEGLAPLVREEIWRCLAALRADGQAILLIDKNVRRLLELADRHVIVEKGRCVWRGTGAELRAAPGLVERHLGV
ncbi:MAG TPA: ABC transporter ATP-binding protein [Geminicoccaceae bacterium]|nr:ABC transporter ATP-binding protein [Geminicoccus sp.]HMU50187.1 ABC transporter ATP-binding protein [Geminicoccaceae bacterium]